MEVVKKINPLYLIENALWFSLKAEGEDFQLAQVIWSVNQIRFRIELEQFQWEQPRLHEIQIAPIAATVESRLRANLITGWSKEEPIPFLQFVSSMKLLFWNCRGAGNNIFKACFKDIVREHNPSVIALMETKVPLSSLGNFFEQLGFSSSIHTDPVGRAGGIWVLWNPNQVDLRSFHISPQCVYAIVTKNNYEDWLLSAVYASPSYRCRKELWEELKVVAEGYNIPWLVAGDFNDHAGNGEKRSFAPSTSINRSGTFLENINNCNLVDLGCNGPRLTWSNNREGMANTLIRLDRALANPQWNLKFPEASVTTLPRTYSDHCPILISTEDAGSFKINTDGSVDQWERGSFGGLVRSDKGKWVEGFCGNIGWASVIKAELWAIRFALKLCKERGWHGVRVESDSLLAVNLIEGEEDETNHPERILVEDCRILIKELNTAVIHTLREGNRCADLLAKLGAKQHEQAVKILVPPDNVIAELKADLQGTAYVRGM